MVSSRAGTSRRAGWIAVLWLGGLLACSGAEAQSLVDVIRQALAQYPLVKSARANAQGAQAELDRAEAARWPVVNLGATASQQDQAPQSLVASPQVTYTVYAGGAIVAGIERAQAGLRGANSKTGATLDDVALQAAEAYLGWGRSLQLLRLATNNLRAHERIFNDIRAIVEVDPGRRVDLRQAELRVSAARLIESQRQVDLVQARNRLARFAANPISTEPQGLDVELGERPGGLEAAMAAAGDDHPVLAQAVAAVDVTTAAVVVARAQTRPKVDLSLVYQVNPYTLRPGILAQLSASMPVFNGGAGTAGVESAQAQRLAAIFALEEQRLALRERIAAAWAEWDAAVLRESLNQGQTQAGDELVSSYYEQFRLARRSLLDLLNVQSEAHGYATAAVQSQFDRRVARYRLAAATGTLALAAR